ncbi:MAG: hypothetical protein K2M11_00345 [Paramuribaculum sp.]|nr:hypothetical protein [Paramuribaculum sp.]
MKAVLTAILFFCCFGAFAQDDVDSLDVDVNDTDVRERGVVLYNDGKIDSGQIPSFIKRAANRIQLNGADWSGLRNSVANSGSEVVSVVHIGDSHIQAEIGTSVTRELLQLDFGNAGRGLVSPLRLSGTNQPTDYTIESGSKWKAEKVMRGPWTNPMGFNGTSLTLVGNRGNLRIYTADDEESYNPFTAIRLFYSGTITITGVGNEYGMPVPYRVKSGNGYVDITLWEALTVADITFETSKGFTFFCASVTNERPGLVYHAIGNNGATYYTYNNVGTTASGIKELSPDLIIVSLGTNEAFGKLDILEFRRNLNNFVTSLKQNNPDAEILLVTPMECQRSSVRRTGTGRRARRVRSYSVNNNILPIRNEILRYGREKHIATYDWYDVAGGTGASNTWIDSELLSRDRVHHTSSGYKLNGKLMYEALINALIPKK